MPCGSGAPAEPRPPGHPRGSCQDKACARTWQAFSDAFTTRNLWAAGFQLTNTDCLGPCQLGPSVLVYAEGILYAGVGPEDVPVIIDEHLMHDQPVERLKAPADVWA